MTWAQWLDHIPGRGTHNLFPQSLETLETATEPRKVFQWFSSLCFELLWSFHGTPMGESTLVSWKLLTLLNRKASLIRVLLIMHLCYAKGSKCLEAEMGAEVLHHRAPKAHCTQILSCKNTEVPMTQDIYFPTWFTSAATRESAICFFKKPHPLQLWHFQTAKVEGPWLRTTLFKMPARHLQSTSNQMDQIATLKGLLLNYL